MRRWSCGQLHVHHVSHGSDVRHRNIRLQKHYEQNGNRDVRKKVIYTYTNWDTLDVLIGRGSRGSNVASDRQKKTKHTIL